MARIAKITGIAVLALVLALAIAVAVLDWNDLRGIVNAQVSERLGRDFAIRGDLDVDLSLNPVVRANDIVIGNPDWASRPHMAEVEQLEFRIHLAPLLTGGIEIPALRVTNPDAYLERSTDGQENWHFPGLEEDDEDEGPLLGSLTIQDGILRFGDPREQTALGFHIETHQADAEADRRVEEARLLVKGSGELRGEPFALDFEGGSVLDLRGSEAPYPLEGRVEMGEHLLQVRGSLARPQRLGGADLDFEIEGPDLSAIQTLVDTELPEIPAFSLNGRLQRQNGSWRLDDFEGRMGDSHLTGNLAVDTAREPIWIEGQVRSDRLNMEDLSGLVGGEPGRGLLETARERGRILPEEPLAFEALGRAEIALDLEATQVITERVRVDRLQARVRLEQGLLRLAPLEFVAAGGAFTGALIADTGQQPPAVGVDIELRKLDLHELLPDSDAVEPEGSQVGGRIELEAHGLSPAALAASATGEVAVVVTRARVSERLINLAGQDILGTLASFFGGDDTIPLYCAVGEFVVEEGRMQARTLAINTEETNFYGEGEIDLGRETLNLTIHPQEDDPTLALGAPLRVTGSLLEPDVGLEGEAIARGAAALGLGALAAPAGLLPLVEPGEETAVGCRRLFKEVEESEASEP